MRTRRRQRRRPPKPEPVLARPDPFSRMDPETEAIVDFEEALLGECPCCVSERHADYWDRRYQEVYGHLRSRQ